MANLEDKHESVTIKYGTAYDVPWHVVTGSNADELAKKLVEYYNLPDASQPFYVLVSQASQVATTGRAIVSGLGGSEVTAPESKPVVTPAAEAPKAAEQSPQERVIGLIAGAVSKADLQNLFLQHEKLVSDDETVRSAFVSKMQSLG